LYNAALSGNNEQGGTERGRYIGLARGSENDVPSLPLRGDYMNDFERNVLEIYRGWDKYEKEHPWKIENPVIDFDVAPPSDVRKFGSRSEILSALRVLLNQASNTASGPIHLEHRRIDASIHYIRRIMGESIPFPTYIERTMGFQPSLFPWPNLQAIYHDIDSRLKAQGFAYNRRFMDSYFKTDRIQSKDEIERRFLSWKDYWLKKLANYIDLPSTLDFTISWVSEDVYWCFWISAKEGAGIDITINTHARHCFTDILLQSLSAHEVAGHAVNMSLIKHRVQSGKIPAYFGITTVHQPEVYAMEGIAQTLPIFIAAKEDFGEEFLLRQSIAQYHAYVLSNAHYQVNMGFSIEDVIKSVFEAAQFLGISEIESQIRDRSLVSNCISSQ
jgi:hypothetical protein